LPLEERKKRAKSPVSFVCLSLVFLNTTQTRRVRKSSAFIRVQLLFLYSLPVSSCIFFWQREPSSTKAIVNSTLLPAFQCRLGRRISSSQSCPIEFFKVYVHSTRRIQFYRLPHLPRSLS
ncbi:hypothetical protein BD769DRAFT_1643745, partial [Suillus cothurnatus]